jgi:hypothetical protein
MPEAAADPPAPRSATRLQHGIHKPKLFTDGYVCYGNLATVGEPTNLQEALKNPHLKDAMDKEYSALMKNNTWHLVPPQRGQNIIDSKWVFKTKG